VKNTAEAEVEVEVEVEVEEDEEEEEEGKVVILKERNTLRQPEPISILINEV
jgi:hypothetical protein